MLNFADRQTSQQFKPGPENCPSLVQFIANNLGNGFYQLFFDLGHVPCHGFTMPGSAQKNIDKRRHYGVVDLHGYRCFHGRDMERNHIGDGWNSFQKLTVGERFG